MTLDDLLDAQEFSENQLKIILGIAGKAIDYYDANTFLEEESIIFNDGFTRYIGIVKLSDLSVSNKKRLNVSGHAKKNHTYLLQSGQTAILRYPSKSSSINSSIKYLVKGEILVGIDEISKEPVYNWYNIFIPHLNLSFDPEAVPPFEWLYVEKIPPDIKKFPESSEKFK